MDSHGAIVLLPETLCHVIIKFMIQNRTMQLAPEHEAVRRPLVELRDALIKLHKVLIESERVGYEKNIGPIKSPNHFFQLLTGDPWFAWLRSISQLIAAIDETLDAKEPLTNDAVNAVMNQSVFLLIPAQSSDEFGERYLAALQRDPRVVLAHAQVAKRIGSGRPGV